MGDGGGGNDQFGNGQNPDSLLGSILRLDVDAATPGAEIWAKGVRNPWRNAWDGNNLYIADVGQGQREEVTVLTTGFGRCQPRLADRGRNQVPERGDDVRHNRLHATDLRIHPQRWLLDNRWLRLPRVGDARLWPGPTSSATTARGGSAPSASPAG